MYTTLPNDWIKWVGCPKALPVADRKRWRKAKGKKLYPQLPKVTLATADAVLITHYAKEEYFNEK